MALSPMMQHYLNTKEQYKDCILMYRLGDFYEMFFDDAITVSKELELTLTGRDCGLAERAPMCGVPYHAVDTYVARLVEKGYNVAIREQMEDPALAKGLVERAVTRVITPGTVIESTMLEEKKNNYLLSVYFGQNEKKAGIAYADVSTGELYVMELPQRRTQLMEELARIAPTEVLVSAEDALELVRIGWNQRATVRTAEAYDRTAAVAQIKKHTGSSLSALGLAKLELAVCAAGALLEYLEETQKNALAHVNTVHIYNRGEHLLLDPVARRNLELTETMRGRGKKGTLLWLLDRTATAMGGRLLRAWIEEPLTQKDKIERRLDAVDELMHNFLLTQEVRSALEPIYDIERLVTKISYGSVNARDALALGNSLKMIPKVKEFLADYRCEALCD
ncbi:MAG: DNA mismatch repair protein MutS, partial [Candidatus Spyradocola sp.]|nr:DNA mismatch repair protein MutS [Candidatus Spyradocola sp.]